MSRFWRLVWLFALASIAGFLLESTESLISLGYVQNRQGLLYGPFTPVYGTGAVFLALLWPLLKNRGRLTVFFIAALTGTLVEYVWSWAQERLFGVIFWDYHHFRFQLDGRVNLPFALLWGLLGLLFWTWLWPHFQTFWASLPRSGAALVGAALALLLVGDSMWSAAALFRQAQRQAHIPAFSGLTAYLDEAWPDEALSRHFPAMKIVQKGQAD